MNENGPHGVGQGPNAFANSCTCTFMSEKNKRTLTGGNLQAINRRKFFFFEVEIT